VTKLQVLSVYKSFGARQVLRGVSLDVGAHQVVSLIGASGSGKSTLLRCINLLEPIDDGSILLDGVDIAEPGLNPDPVRRRIGMVFQSYNLFPHMSVLRNITHAPCKVLGTSKSQAEQHAHDLLRRFDLDDKASAYPDQLSGGQQQRVAIVRSLAMQPEIILLDEVTVLNVIRDVRTAGMTMVLATHEMGFAKEISDTVCFLKDGIIVEHGPPDQLFHEPIQQDTRDFLARVIASGRL
jgi:polar amino acid transport system ATP-binding protein